MKRLAVMCWIGFAPAVSALDVNISYLAERPEEVQVLTELEERPDDLGAAGAALAQNDNNTTGQFLDQNYILESSLDLERDDLINVAQSALEAGHILVLDASDDALLAVADLPVASDGLIFNAGAEDNALRQDQCRANVLHTIPSLAMRTDALAQFLSYRKWTGLALISGAHAQDQNYADALRGSLAKYGFDQADEFTWEYDADMRRSAFLEGPLFAQEFSDKDMVLVADEVHDFARYLIYNTWTPQLMAGSEGLQSEAWSGVVEQWGAAQLQNRFIELAGREMQSQDYAAWAALRSIGEAVTRTGSADVSGIRSFLLSADFELAGFKGEPLSFRDWNGQLRQPMPIFHERALVALAPLEGFLHQHSELDTLGIDRPENNCEGF